MQSKKEPEEAVCLGLGDQDSVPNSNTVCGLSDMGSEKAVAMTVSIDMAALASPPEVSGKKNEANIYNRRVQDYLDDYMGNFEGGDLGYYGDDGFSIFADPGGI